MKPTLLFRAAPLALIATTAQASPSMRDFELPPGPTATPTTSAPQVQGPVDPDAPLATRPRPVESPAAQASATPSPTDPPLAQPTVPAASSPATNPRPPSPAASNTPAATGISLADDAAPEAAVPVDTRPPDSAIPGLPTPEVTGTPSGAEESLSLGTILGAAAGLVILLGGLATGLLWWRRRQPAAATAPQIELLLVTPEADLDPGSPPAGLPRADSAPMLQIEATPNHLTRSMMAATFSCRVALVNRGGQPVEDITVGLDLTTAHGSVPAHEQLADPARPLPEVGRFARIGPGETIEFAQEVRLPTAEIRTLRQGEARLYVPLLRVRAQAGGAEPIARTFIVGTLPEGSARKLQPFRLDEMPQTYRMIGVAALD